MSRSRPAAAGGPRPRTAGRPRRRAAQRARRAGRARRGRPARAGAPLGRGRRIAVLLVDGLGWYQVPTAAPYAPTLAGLAATGARPLIAGFPSTTPTSLVSLGTGAPPGAHGVLGFTVRVPGTDGCSPTPTGPATRPAALAAGAHPVGARPRRRRDDDRGEPAGVRRQRVDRGRQPGRRLPGRRRRGRGGRRHAGRAGRRLRADPGLRLPRRPGPARPLSGVDSAPWRVAATEVDRLVARLVDGLPPDAALLVTADHGQLDVPAAHRFDLDTDPRLRAGVRLVAGEARVRYLHVEPGAVDDVLAAWSEVLGAAAGYAPATRWWPPAGSGRCPRSTWADRRRGGDLQRHVRGHGQSHRAADGVEVGGVPRVGHRRRADRAAAGRPRLTGARSGPPAAGGVVPPG